MEHRKSDFSRQNKVPQEHCHSAHDYEHEVPEKASDDVFDDLAWSSAWFPALYDTDADNLPDESEEPDDRLR